MFLENRMDNVHRKGTSEGARSTVQRILIGVLFAAALIFIEAGISALVLGRDAECRAEAERLRYRFVTDEDCLTEVGREFYQVLLTGAAFAASGTVSAAAAVFVNLLIHAGLGSVLSLMKLKWGLLTFIVVHLLLILGGTMAAVIALYSA